MNFLQTQYLLADVQDNAGGSGEWSKLTEKLEKVGSSTKSLVDVIQDYWFIPMLIGLIIIAVLVFAGGREGRVQAKSKLAFFLIGTAIIMMLPTVVSLILDVFGRERASTWTYSGS